MPPRRTLCPRRHATAAPTRPRGFTGKCRPDRTGAARGRTGLHSPDRVGLRRAPAQRQRHGRSLAHHTGFHRCGAPAQHVLHHPPRAEQPLRHHPDAGRLPHRRPQAPGRGRRQSAGDRQRGRSRRKGRAPDQASAVSRVVQRHDATVLARHLAPVAVEHVHKHLGQLRQAIGLRHRTAESVLPEVEQNRILGIAARDQHLHRRVQLPQEL